MKYAMLICGRGDYAAFNHSDSAWEGTVKQEEMEIVEAESASAAMDAFIRRFGIFEKYREANGASVTDSGLNEFVAVPLDEVIA